MRGEDYDSVYAPMVDFSVALIVLALSNVHNWYAKHVEITTAFLNGDTDRVMYVAHPINAPADLSSDAYYQIINSLYGLKQAPLQWFLKLLKILRHKLGYTQLNSDGAVFLRKDGYNIVLILVYLEYTIFVGNKKSALNKSIQDI